MKPVNMLKPNNGMGAIKGTSKDMTATAKCSPDTLP